MLPDGEYQFAKSDGSRHTVLHLPDVNGNNLDQTVENRLQISGEQNDKVVDYSAVKLDLKGVLIPDYACVGRLNDLYLSARHDLALTDRDDIDGSKN